MPELKIPEKIADTFVGVALNDIAYLVERETGFESASCDNDLMWAICGRRLSGTLGLSTR